MLANLISIPFLTDSGLAGRTEKVHNPELSTILKGFDGNSVKGGSFQNLYGQAGGKSLWRVIKWRFSQNPQKEEKQQEKYSLPVYTDAFPLREKDDFILWLGHASYLIQTGGRRILTDPCLTSPPFVDRLTKLPIPVRELKPDYLLISHGHYDHLDSDSLKHFGGATALIPLNMSGLIKDIQPEISCREAGWYQQYDLAEDFQVVFLPAHHWHRRGMLDYNKVLWGSYLIKTPNSTIYFGGDSGYSRHFQDIGELLGPIDLAILPIGAYSPQWFMKSSHITPEEALRAAEDLQARTLIPMHYGTFDLSDEPLGEPENRLKSISKKEKVRFLDIGRKYLFNTV